MLGLIKAVNGERPGRNVRQRQNGAATVQQEMKSRIVCRIYQNSHNQLSDCDVYLHSSDCCSRRSLCHDFSVFVGIRPEISVFRQTLLWTKAEKKIILLLIYYTELLNSVKQTWRTLTSDFDHVIYKYMFTIGVTAVYNFIRNQVLHLAAELWSEINGDIRAGKLFPCVKSSNEDPPHGVMLL